HLIEGQGAKAHTFIFEIVLQRVLAGREHVRAFPLDVLIAYQVPVEYRLAFQEVEPVSSETATLGHDHALSAPLRHPNACGDVVRGIQHRRGVAHWNTGHWLRVNKLLASGSDVRTWRHNTCRTRGI